MNNSDSDKQWRDILSCLDRMGDASGVTIHVADYLPSTNQRGLGIGMQEIQKGILQEARPALILGLESSEEVSARGFHVLLYLPWISYLELPITPEKVQQAAQYVAACKPDCREMDGVRQEVIAYTLEAIRRNVSHRFQGVIQVAVKQAVRASRRIYEASDPAIGAQKDLENSMAALVNSDENIRYSLKVLQREKDWIEDICEPEMSQVLEEQSSLLSEAADDLAGFVAGINAWINGDLPRDSLVSVAVTGKRVSKTFERAVTEFTRLASVRGIVG